MMKWTIGIYDSGSNVSIINYKLLRLKQGKNNLNNENLITINGVKKSSGLANLKIRIFDIEEKTNVVIVDEENFKYDFLIGLDMITKFKLCQDENLNITQKADNKKEEMPEEIKSEASDIKKENKNIKKFLVNFNEHKKRGFDCKYEALNSISKRQN